MFFTLKILSFYRRKVLGDIIMQLTVKNKKIANVDELLPQISDCTDLSELYDLLRQIGHSTMKGIISPSEAENARQLFSTVTNRVDYLENNIKNDIEETKMYSGLGPKVKVLTKLPQSDIHSRAGAINVALLFLGMSATAIMYILLSYIQFIK